MVFRPGALGLEPMAEGRLANWQRMYDVKELGSLRAIRALAPS
ncbi:hypothetical protein AB0G05_28945 [Nonomuraea wenchangensis]